MNVKKIDPLYFNIYVLMNTFYSSNDSELGCGPVSMLQDAVIMKTSYFHPQHYWVQEASNHSRYSRRDARAVTMSPRVVSSGTTLPSTLIINKNVNAGNPKLKTETAR